MSKFRSYIDKHNRPRCRFKSYIVFLIYVGVLSGIGSNYCDLLEYHLINLHSSSFSTSSALVSHLIAWYRSAAFVDENLFTDYSGVFPDLNDLARQEMRWLARMWIFWGAGMAMALPLILFLSFQLGKRLRDRMRGPPEIKEGGLPDYNDVRKQILRAFWRANNNNFGKAIFLACFLGSILFSIQFLLQPFLMPTHNLSLAIMASFLIYVTLVYFFFLCRQRFSYSKVVKIIDRKMGLGESLVTALELNRDYRESALYLYLLKETGKKVRKENLLGFFPRKFPRFSRRNVGITVLSLAVTTFFVTLSLPAVAFVYDNLHHRFFVPLAREKIVEEIILEESEQIKLLSEDIIKEKESPELKFLSMELSDLSRKLIDMVLTEEEVDDIQVPNLMLSQQPKENQPEDKVKKEKEKKKNPAKDEMYRDEIVSSESLDVYLTAQISAIMKDLINYDLNTKIRKSTVNARVQPNNKPSISGESSTSLKASKGSLSQTKDPDIKSVPENNIPDSMGRDMIKLQQLISRIGDIRTQLNRLDKQLPRSTKPKQLDPGGSPDKSWMQSQLSKLFSDNLDLKRETSYRSSPDGAKPADNRQEVTNSSSGAPVRKMDITPLESHREENTHKDQNNPQNEDKKKEEENKENKEMEIRYPTNVRLYRDDLEELSEWMKNWEFDWDDDSMEMDLIGDHQPIKLQFNQRMQINIKMLKEFNDKLITITEPENITGIPSEAVNPVIKVKNPQLIRNMVSAARDRGIVNPAMISSLSDDLRMITNDLETLNSQINDLLKGQRKISDFRTAADDKNPIKRLFEDPSGKQNAYQADLTDRDTSNNSLSNVSQFRPQLRRPNVTPQFQVPEAIKLANRNRDKMQSSIKRGNLQFFRSGINPENILREAKGDGSGLKGIRDSLRGRINADTGPQKSSHLSGSDVPEVGDDSVSDNMGLNNSRITQVVGEMRNLLTRIRDQGSAAPTDPSQTSNNHSSPLSRDALRRIESLSQQIRREPNPDNLRNLSGDLARMVMEARNRIIEPVSSRQPGKNLPPGAGLDKARRNIDQLAQRLLQERNTANLLNMAGNLAGMMQDYQNRKQPDTTTPSAENNQQRLQQQMNRLSHQLRSESNPQKLQALGENTARLARQMRNQALTKGLPPFRTPTVASLQTPLAALETQNYEQILQQMRSEKHPDRLKDLGAQLSRLTNRLQDSNPRHNPPPEELNKPQSVTPTDRQMQSLVSGMQSEQNPRSLDNLAAELVREARKFMDRHQIPRNIPTGQNPDLNHALNIKEISQLERQLRRTAKPLNLRNLSSELSRRVQEFRHRQLPEGTPDQEVKSEPDGRRMGDVMGRPVQESAPPMFSERNWQNSSGLSRGSSRSGQDYRREHQSARGLPDNIPGGLRKDQPLERLDRNLKALADQFRQTLSQDNRRNLAGQIVQSIAEFTDRNTRNGKLPANRNSGLGQQLAYRGDQIRRLSHRMQQEMNPQNMNRLQGELLHRVDQFRRDMRREQNTTNAAGGNSIPQSLQLDRELQEAANIMRQDGNLDKRRDMQIAHQRLQAVSSQNMQNSRIPGNMPRNLPSITRQASINGQIQDLSRRMRNERNPQNFNRLQGQLLNQESQLELQKNMNTPLTTSGKRNARMTARQDRDLGETVTPIQESNRAQSRPEHPNRLVPRTRELNDINSQSNHPLEQPPRDSGKNQQLTLLGKEISELSKKMQSERNSDKLSSLRNDLAGRVRDFREQIQSVSSSNRSRRNNANLNTDQLSGDINRLVNQLDRERNLENRRDLATRLASRIRDFKNREANREPENPVRNTPRSIQSGSRNIQSPASQMRNEKNQERMQNLKNEMLQQARQFQNRVFKGERSPNRQADLHNRQAADLKDTVRRLNERLRREQNPAQARMLSEQLSATVRDFSDSTAERKSLPQEEQTIDGPADTSTFHRDSRDSNDRSQARRDRKRSSSDLRENTPRQQKSPSPDTDPMTPEQNRRNRVNDPMDSHSPQRQNRYSGHRGSNAGSGNSPGNSEDNLNSRMKQLSRDLVQETNPDRIRKLTEDIDRLTHRLQSKTDLPRNNRNRLPGGRQADRGPVNGLSGRTGRLSDLTRNEQNPGEPRKRKNRPAGNPARLQKKMLNDSNRLTERLSGDLRREDRQERIRDTKREIPPSAGQLPSAGLFPRNRHRSPGNGQAHQRPLDPINQARYLAGLIRAERNPSKLRDLKNRLADNLAQLPDQLPDRRNQKEIPRPADPSPPENNGLLQNRIAGRDSQNQTDKHNRSSPGDNSPEIQPVGDSFMKRINSLSRRMNSVREPRTLKRLQREMVSVIDQMLNASQQLSPGQAEDPQSREIEALNNRIQNLARKLLDDRPVEQRQKIARQLSSLSQELVQQMPDLPTSRMETPSSGQRQSPNLTSSIQALTHRIQNTKKNDSIIEDGRQLAMLARQMTNIKPAGKAEPRQKVSPPSQRLDPNRQSLIDGSLRLQWLSNKIQRESDPEKIQKFQDQLVKLSRKTSDSIKQLLPHSASLPPKDKFQQKRDYADRLMRLSRNLKQVNRTPELDKLSDRMDSIVEKLIPVKDNLPPPANDPKHQINQNLRLPKTGTRNPSMGAAALPHRQNARTDGNKYSGRGGKKKSTLAIGMIDKMLQKLNSYRAPSSALWKKSSKTPDGAINMGSGNSQQPLPLANRFIADKLAKETNRIPAQGHVRNALSMERNLHLDETLERITRRLEKHKERIRKSGNTIMTKKDSSLKDYSGIKRPRKPSKQSDDLENIRYSEKKFVVEYPGGKTEAKITRKKTVSYMDNSQEFLNIRLKTTNKELLEMIPERKMMTKKNTDTRLSSIQEAANSVNENSIPSDYRSILQRVFLPGGTTR